MSDKIFQSKKATLNVNIYRFVFENFKVDLSKMDFPILHKLVQFLQDKRYEDEEAQMIFKKFRDCFDFFLNLGISINAKDTESDRIPMQYLTFNMNHKLAMLVVKYLINKGSDLLYKSNPDGSILHTLFCNSNSVILAGAPKYFYEVGVYIIIRSLDLNPLSNSHQIILQQINNNDKNYLDLWKKEFQSLILYRHPPILHITKRVYRLRCNDYKYFGYSVK